MRNSREKGAGMGDQDPPLPDPLVWGYSFLFGNTYVRPRKWSKIHKYQIQNRNIYGIKILNKKEKRESC